MGIALSYPEEMIGRTVSSVVAAREVVNIGFSDGTSCSIKMGKTDLDVKEHLRRIKKREHELLQERKASKKKQRTSVVIKIRENGCCIQV